MKILIISSCLGSYGGIESFVLALSKYLKSIDGVDVRLRFKKANGFSPTSELEKLSEEAGVNYGYVNKLSKELFREILWSDLVHAQNAPPDVALFCKLLKKPFVLTIHNWLRRDGSLRSYSWQWASRLARRRWYNSNFVLATWEPGGAGIGSSRVPTISHMKGHEISTYLRRGFVFVARWIPNKGLEDLLEAYSRCEFDPRIWPLHLIGDGPLRDEIHHKIQVARITGVVIHGFVSEAKKMELISKARWLVACSNTREDMGLTPIEARSVGVPCIVTRDGGLPESGGEMALSCEPGNVEQLAATLQKAVSMSEEEYEKKSLISRESLSSYIVPMSFYPQQYTSVLKDAQ